MPHDFIRSAQEAISSGTRDMTERLPMLIAHIIREELWRGRTDRDGRAFECFEQFAEYPFHRGLECPMDKLKRYCGDHPECGPLLDSLVVPVKGRGAPEGNKNAANDRNKGDNVTFDSGKKERGNSRDYILARLKRDAGTDAKAADLLDKLTRRELSARQAALAMSYVKPPDPVATVERLIPTLDEAGLARIAELIEQTRRERAP